MRVFEQALFKALLIPAGSRAHYAGKQPNASVKDGKRRHLAAGQNDVGKADLLDLRPGVEQAFVEAFKPPAQDDDAGPLGKFADAGLGDRFAARSHGEDGHNRRTRSC